jgi:hypothetical protein
MLYDNMEGWYLSDDKKLFLDTNNNGIKDAGENWYLYGSNYIYTNPIHVYTKPQPVGHIFCRDAIATGQNVLGATPVLPKTASIPYGNPAERGNCKSQIKIKSWGQ